MNHRKVSKNTETKPDGYIVLPIVFTVNTISGGDLTHLGTLEKTPLCGTKLYKPVLTDVKIKIDDDQELREFWDSTVNTPKWIRVAKYNYCKRCLSALNGG